MPCWPGRLYPSFGEAAAPARGDSGTLAGFARRRQTMDLFDTYRRMFASRDNRETVIWWCCGVVASHREGVGEVPLAHAETIMAYRMRDLRKAIASTSTMAQKPNTTSTSPSRWKSPACPGYRWARRSNCAAAKVWSSATAKRTAATRLTLSEGSTRAQCARDCLKHWPARPANAWAALRLD